MFANDDLRQVWIDVKDEMVVRKVRRREIEEEMLKQDLVKIEEGEYE